MVFSPTMMTTLKELLDRKEHQPVNHTYRFVSFAPGETLCIKHQQEDTSSAKEMREVLPHPLPAHISIISQGTLIVIEVAKGHVLVYYVSKVLVKVEMNYLEIER